MVNAVIALIFQILFNLDFTNGNTTFMAAPGMATLASNFSAGTSQFIYTTS